MGGVLRRRARRTLDLTDAVAAAGAGSLAAADGTFSVVQVVTGVPDDVQAAGSADVHLVLTVAGGRARLGLDPSGDGDRRRRPSCSATPRRWRWPRGASTRRTRWRPGRVRVRGDLAALVAGQDVLAEAAARLGTDLEELTEPPAPAP